MNIIRARVSTSISVAPEPYGYYYTPQPYYYSPQPYGYYDYNR